MSVRHFILWLILLLLFKGFSSFSQAGFTQIPAPGGSWGGYFIFGTQDPKGYMWFGANGVHRYDGYSYKSYYHDPLDSSSLAFNRIQAILADREGIIWIGTNGVGLDRLDPETGIFTHFRHDPADSNTISNDLISVILEDKLGKIWVGTESGGLNHLDPKTGMITRFRHNPNDTSSLSHDEVRALYEDRQGTIWVGTGFPSKGEEKKGGLNRFNRNSKTFTRFLHDPEDPSSLIDNRIWTIYEDSKGRFWVGTAGDGLHRMNRDKGTFKRYRYNAADPNGLSRPPLNNTSSWMEDFISFVCEDAAGNFWIGAALGGLNRYNMETKSMSHYTSLKENSTVESPITGFNGGFISKDGTLWVTGDEVFRLDPLRKPIPHYQIGHTLTSILQEHSGQLWLGTNEGLIVYDSTRKKMKQFVHGKRDSRSLSNNHVLSLLQDNKGVIWIGTDIGLNRFDRETQRFIRFYPADTSDIDRFIPKNSISSIFEDQADSLWLMTYSLLSSMNRQRGTYKYFGDGEFDTLQNRLSIILESKAGYLWIGTPSGLKQFDRVSNVFRHYLSGFSIQSIFEDTDAVLWFGTNRGLYRLNHDQNDFEIFTNASAALNSSVSVFHILEDDQRSLWINTSTGLFKLDQNRSEIRLFGKRYGMIASSEGTQNGCFKGIGGELFFGDNTGNGYYAFFPHQLRGNTIAPNLHITAFRLGDQPVVSGMGSTLSKPISETKELRLSHDQNIFSFDFVGIHYSSPEDNQHLFKLENFDNDWRRAGEERSASYNNVPPGNYVFRVKASSSNGIWSEKAITVVILPPWWKTWWAYSIYGLLFIAGVFTTHSIQKKRVIKAERERTREKELAQAKEIEKAYHDLKTTQAQLVQREKMASLGELTAGIAHEIQNPLNFVNNFSEVNVELLSELRNSLSQKLSETENGEVAPIFIDLTNNLEKISHHGKRADAIVKGMLQHSRTSNGKKEPTDINALVDEYLRLSYHGLRATDKYFNATLKTDYDKSIGSINIIPQDIGRVVLNLITNAFYAVSEKRKQQPNGYESIVGVSTKKLDTKVEITVKDNGNGIPQKLLDKIFQPFFTTKPAGLGTGLGLSLSYDIVKAHDGELQVETEEGVGTAFIVYLPVT